MNLWHLNAIKKKGMWILKNVNYPPVSYGLKYGIDIFHGLNRIILLSQTLFYFVAV